MGVPSSASALPIATTESPTSSVLESPSSHDRQVRERDLHDREVVRRVDTDAPTRSALRPSASVTLIVNASAATCALVTMTPLLATMKPVPVPWPSGPLHVDAHHRGLHLAQDRLDVAVVDDHRRRPQRPRSTESTLSGRARRRGTSPTVTSAATSAPTRPPTSAERALPPPAGAGRRRPARAGGAHGDRRVGCGRRLPARGGARLGSRAGRRNRRSESLTGETAQRVRAGRRPRARRDGRDCHPGGSPGGGTGEPAEAAPESPGGAVDDPGGTEATTVGLVGPTVVADPDVGDRTSSGQRENRVDIPGADQGTRSSRLTRIVVLRHASSVRLWNDLGNRAAPKTFR